MLHFKMLRSGQKCKFCHIEYRDKKGCNKFNKTPIDFIFSTHGAYYSFQKLFMILQNGALVTIALF